MGDLKRSNKRKNEWQFNLPTNEEAILHEIDLVIKWIPQKSATWIATWKQWKIFLFHVYEPDKEVNAIYFASDGNNVLIDSNWSGIKKKISDTKPVR